MFSTPSKGVRRRPNGFWRGWGPQRAKQTRQTTRRMSRSTGIRLDMLRDWKSKSRIKAIGGNDSDTGGDGARSQGPQSHASTVASASTHGHGDSARHVGRPQLRLSVLSGLTLGLFLYVTANVFGILLFETDTRLHPEAQLGTYMTLASAIVGGAVLTTHSACRVIVAGPNIVPVLCLIEICAYVADRIHDDEKLLPTVMALLAFFSALTALTFFLMGRFRLTKLVQFLPAAVSSGFLGSVGLLIVKEAVVVATGYHWKAKYLRKMWLTWKSWRQILCSLPVGIPLYVLKRYHLVHPSILVPAFIAVPLAVFYAALAAAGASIDDARAAGWFFDKLSEKQFYQVYTALDLNRVDWAVFADAQPIVFVCLLVVAMDVLVHLTRIEGAANQNLDVDREVNLAGRANAAALLCIAPPAYGIAGFTKLNIVTVGSVQDRVPGYVAVGVLAALFFGGFPVVNYLPRFLCAGLILYKGIGTLWEQVWDARFRLSKMELCAVMLIIVVSYFTGLEEAVVTGVILSSVIFAIKYARHYDVQRTWSLRTIHSSVVRLKLERQKLEQLGERMLGLQLNGFLFFGSGIKLHEIVAGRLTRVRQLPPYRRTSHVVLDFLNVEGLDAAAARMFLKIQRHCAQQDCTVVWSGLTRKLRGKLEYEHVQLRYSFPSFDHAVEFVEEAVLDAAQEPRSKWFVLPAMIKMHCLASNSVFSGHLDEIFSETHISGFCDKVLLRAGSVLFRRGDELGQIWLLHRGKVCLSTPGDLPAVQRLPTWLDKKERSRRSATSGKIDVSDGEIAEKRVAVLKRGVVSSTLPGMLCAETARCLEASTFITINKDQLYELQEMHPHDALRLQRLVIQDIAETKSQLSHKAVIDQARRDGEDADKKGRGSALKATGSEARAIATAAMQLHKSTRMLCSIADMATALSPRNATRRADPLRSVPGMLHVPSGEQAEQKQKRFGIAQASAKHLTKPLGLLKVARQGTKTSARGTLVVGSEQYLHTYGDHARGEWDGEAESRRGSVSISATPQKRISNNAGNKQVITVRIEPLGGKSKGERLESEVAPIAECKLTEASEGGGPDEETPAQATRRMLRYTLSRHQRFTYRQIFKSLCVAERKSEKQRGEGVGRDAASPRQMPGRKRYMDMAHLRHALLDCGFYVTPREVAHAKRRLGYAGLGRLSLRQFFKFMRVVAMAELPVDVDKAYRETYDRFAAAAEGSEMGVVELHRLMNEVFDDSFAPEDLNKLIDQWGNIQEGTLSRQNFVSMMAFSQKQNELESQVEKAFDEFAGGEEEIHWYDIQAGIARITGHEISDAEAKEMLWEADTRGKGYLDRKDFLQLVVTVYKPGYVVLWNYIDRRRETVRLDHLRDEDLNKFDQEVRDFAQSSRAESADANTVPRMASGDTSGVESTSGVDDDDDDDGDFFEGGVIPIPVRTDADSKESGPKTVAPRTPRNVTRRARLLSLSVGSGGRKRTRLVSGPKKGGRHRAASSLH